MSQCETDNTGARKLMTTDPALEAHEQTERAGHAAHDPFVARVAITVAALAVLAAVAGSFESVEGGRALGASSEAVLAQDEATDSWNEYQAESLKKHLYGIAADMPGGKSEAYRRIAREEVVKQGSLRIAAVQYEAKRDKLLAESRKHDERHHWLTGAATLFEIGIAMSTVAIISRKHWLWAGATVFGVLGGVVFAVAYLA
jgi:hypothetical protein